MNEYDNNSRGASDSLNISFNVRQLLFIPHLIERISNGDLFKKVFSVFLKSIAILTALGGIVLWIKIWGTISDLNFSGVFGGLIFQLGYLVALYAFVHVLWIRANQINSLPGTGYSVIPISSIFCKTLGELYASIQVTMSTAVGIFIWIGGYSYETRFLLEFFMPSNILSGLVQGNFLTGVLVMISGFILSFFVLLFFYFLSEVIRLGVDIAQNTAATRGILESNAGETNNH